VVNNDFTDAALVLIGHGSTRNADSRAPVYQHANELRRRNLFAQVLECFWKEEPGIAGVLRRVVARRIFIVPLFISEGYFTQQAIPSELGLCAPGETLVARTQQRGQQTLSYCSPVGSHSSMTEALLARAREVVEQHPFPRAPKPAEIALFIAGHGTSQNENSRISIERQADLIRRRQLYAEIHPVFLEEAPRLEDCYRMAQANNIVLVPFFISDGLHSREDIPIRLGESAAAVQQRLKNGQPTWRNPTERHGKRLWYSGSIGTESHIADVILELVVESSKLTV
jgi:sirohydrochlorin cobaltochelatase